MRLYENKAYLIRYNPMDNRLYFFKKLEDYEEKYIGNRHLMDLIDLVEQDNEKEEI